MLHLSRRLSLCGRPAYAAAVAGLIVAAIVAASPVHAGSQLTIVSVQPTPRTIQAPVGGPIVVEFDRPVDPATVTDASFWAFGRWSGTASGAITVSPDGLRATLTPTHAFSAGEQVTVYIANTLRGDDRTPLRSAGYSFQFWTRAAPATMVYEEIDRFSTRTTPGQTSRAYGGFASDLDGDRFLDLTIINEDTDDLRVFMNQADGSGLFGPFLRPTAATGNVPSPSEPSDFNHDGFVDVCVGNTQGSSISIFLGNGDGTFQPQQFITVGAGQVRGITVLDADGDGDVDIVNTNRNDDTYSVVLNDGTGTFGTPTFYDPGGDEPWPISAADMNEDGILDLIIGVRDSPNPKMIVRIGVGDGTFALGSVTNGGGTGFWMLNCGDINGDRHEDVVVVNGFSNTASIYLGDGAGRLDPPTTMSPDPFPLATDLADLDGDGDLDWVVSSFQGDWFVYRNDGTGTFTFDQDFVAPQAASCCLALDFDNDGDLDLALIDELSDEVILLRSVSTPCPGDIDGNGEIDFQDLLQLLAAWGPCGECAEDVDQNAVVDFQDLLLVLASWGLC